MSSTERDQYRMLRPGEVMAGMGLPIMAAVNQRDVRVRGAAITPAEAVELAARATADAAPTISREAFARKRPHYSWETDKLFLPCGPDRGCDYAACQGWCSEFEDSLQPGRYTDEEVAEAKAFRDQMVADGDFGSGERQC